MYETKVRIPKAIEEKAQPALVKEAHNLHFDGAFKKKIEQAAAGIVIHDPMGLKIHQEGFLLPGVKSNNEAKYAALIKGLEKGLDLGISKLLVYGDAMLIIKQIKGTWACKNFGLVPHMKKVRQLMKEFKFIEIHHVVRTKNQEGDALA